MWRNYLAESRTLGLVAVKKTSINEDDSEIIDYQNEIRILSQMNSQFIIRFFGTTDSNGGVSIVVEYAANGSLCKYLENIRKQKVEANFYEKKVSNSDRYCQRIMHSKRILHQDLSSMNYVLDENLRAKIAGFGLS